jgi:tetratricopeptide (TPR) repeat protein
MAAWPPTSNPAAYDLYLRGRYHWNQRTGEGLRKAADFFRQATAEDPGFCLAYSGFSDASALLCNYGLLPPFNLWAEAGQAADTAVRLDGESAEARASLAHVMATHRWEWKQAGPEFLRAIALNPRYATAHHWYALTCLAPQGRLDEAREEMRLARMLDPVSWSIARDTAVIDFYRHDYPDAIAACERTLDLAPAFASAYWILGLIHSQTGGMDQAIGYLSKAVRLAPEAPRLRAAVGWALATAGSRAGARAVLDELVNLSARRYVAPFDFFTASVALGDEDAALFRLAEACRHRNFEAMFVHLDPRFAEVVRRPAYIRLVSSEWRCGPPSAVTVNRLTSFGHNA